MRRIPKLRLTRKQIALLIGVIGLLTVSGLLLWRHHRQLEATRAYANIPSIVQENLLLLNELRDLDTRHPALTIDVQSLRGKLDENHNIYQNSASKSKYKEREPKKSGLIDEMYAEENAVLQDFDQAYALYGKPIAYRPLQDIGSLNPKDSLNEINTRLDTAVKNLTGVTQGVSSRDLGNGLKSEKRFNVPNEVKEAIALSISCLRDLKTVTETTKTEELLKRASACDDQYLVTRASTGSTLLSTLKGDNEKSLEQTLNNLIQELNK